MARRKKKRRTLGAASEAHRSRLRMDARSARDAANSAIKYAEHGDTCSTAIHFLTDAAARVGSVETNLATMASGKKRNEDYNQAGLAKADFNKALRIVITKCSR